MPVPIIVVLVLPTQQESMAHVGAQVWSTLRINDGLNPISRVFDNFGNGYPVDCTYALEKAQAEQESNDDVELVGSTPKDVVYRTPKPA